MIILIVEDDDLIRASTVDMMRRAGHEVHEASDAEAAMALLRDTPVDVLLADVRLPGMSGDVFAAEARAVRPSVQIVFATGMAYLADKGVQERGPVLLRKPYDADELQAALVLAQSRR